MEAGKGESYRKKRKRGFLKEDLKVAANGLGMLTHNEIFENTHTHTHTHTGTRLEVGQELKGESWITPSQLQKEDSWLGSKEQ